MTAADTAAPPQKYPARVFFIEDIAADTRLLRLELDNGRKLPFRAGQYALLTAADVEPRAFSIASAPAAPYLEFHVKNSGHGFSAFAFNNLAIGSPVTVDAPWGDHFWRPSARPLLALAGGVGIAPLKAIVEAQLEHARDAKTAAPVHLYWAVRDETHLYLDHFFLSLAEAHPAFAYTPIIAHADTTHAEGAGRRSGYIGPAVMADFASLAGHNIYLAGPAPMVNATLPLLLERGAEKDFIFSDAFGG
ncbi:MAG: FAD-binding oxidoreductase [Micavibrio sp.]|nr:FAD-binding oxidoreductase [Micavibrio sp.]